MSYLEKANTSGGGGGGGDTLTQRGSEPTAYDFTQADLTLDSAWHDLDLSSIVPAGASAALFLVSISDNSASQHIRFRPNGYTTIYGRGEVRTQAANVYNYGHLIIFLDANRTIEYEGNSGITSIGVSVLGWWT